MFRTTLKWMGLAALYLFKGQVLKKEEGASFASRRDYSRYMNRSNTGLLLDGVSLKLSEPESFQNVCVIARIGAGKTSRYIIPNVLSRANQKCSMVINDPKGEVYDQTSAFLASKGYDVILINPERPDLSHCFNPLAEAKSEIEQEQVAEILVKCGNPSSGGGKDEFWSSGAIRFVSLFIKCLANGREQQPQHYNLANLYYLFQNFGQDGSALDDWISRASVNPADVTDETLFNEWQGVLTGNTEGVQSFVLNAITSLKALSNRNIALLTSKSDFELESMREKKTAIFFVTPPQHAEYYAFLTSVFFRSVFNACMRKMPSKSTLPVYCFYDEFGHSTIPNFVSTANTIRGYKVSLSIVLQSISQLNARYGRDYAYSIQGGFNTNLTYSGADPETAKFFETIIGRKRVTQLPNNVQNYNEQYREENLINSNEVRTLGQDQVLIVSTNRDPVLTRATPFFTQGRFKRMVNKGAYTPSASMPDAVKYVSL
ncbi:type IV secretory system conjugative DNA transfer family protein [Gammaproteobacteria bacterium]|nr:type IV secretory system conjugative DNA transfer family protein [Gammaproteobacteria bacterium]